MPVTRNALLGFGHGALWKLGALASKLGFVFIVLPNLPDGVFADYSIWMSIALFIALALSFGAVDGLPVFVRGRLVVRDALAPLVQSSLLVTAFLFLIFLGWGGHWSLVAALVGCNVCYLVLSGILRSTDPYLYEILSNAPSILFLIVSIVLPIHNLNLLLIIFFASNFVVPVGVALSVGLLKLRGARSVRYSGAALQWLVIRGNVKSASAMLMIADFRALITTPSVLRGIQPSDALAVALTIGEAFWQLGMVVVNRNYARYCSGQGSLLSSVQFSCCLLLLLGVAGCFLLWFPPPVSIPRFD